MDDNYKQKPVLNKSLQGIRAVIETRIGKPGSHSPQFLFHIQPSTLRDLQSIVLEKPQYKSAYFNGSIEIALAVGYRDTKVIAVVINSKDVCAADTAVLLQAWHIKSFVADFESEQEEIVNFLADSWSQRSEYAAATKRITNDPEDWFRRICDYATGNILNNSKKALYQELKNRGFDLWQHIFPKRYEIFREVALDRLVEIPVNKTKDAEFARKTRVDLVIARAEPSLLPYIVIEIDGPHHDVAKQVAKDKLKNSILSNAKIPCMRLALKDLGFNASNRSKKVIDLEDERIKIEFSTLLEKIIQSIVDGLYYETDKIPGLYKKADQAIAQTLEAKIKDYQISNSRIDISDDDIELLLLTAEEECIDSTLDAKYEEHLLSTEKNLLRTGGLLADELCKKLGDVIKKFEYKIDGDGFSHAACFIEDRHGHQTFFQSPKIRIRLEGLDLPILDISINDIVKEHSRSYVLKAVCTHLKIDLHDLYLLN